MSLISFTATGGSFTPSRNPTRPQVLPSPQQATDRTSGGVPYGFDPVITEEVIPLAWQGMSAADVSALRTFFSTTVRGIVEIFTVADPWQGGTYTACFAEPTLNITETSYDRYNVTCSLRRVIA